jgi:LPS-assembly protein
MLVRVRHLLLFSVIGVVAGSGMATAQTATQTSPAETVPGQPPPPPPKTGGVGGCGLNEAAQQRLEQLSESHWKLTGQVEIACEKSTFFADEVEFFTDSNRLSGKGNVVFVSPEGRLSADAVDFDTKNMVGVFTNASGIMSLGPKADRQQFGGQDPDVYFFGDTVEKVGEKKYKVTRGAFTTCVQPTPRWELASGTVTINLDDYALLHNTVLRVKGVPLFYVPLAYYPLHKEQRATGFLLPTYGTSSIRGQAISNAFFLVMGRSMDATFFHDWFTRTGQGVGTEFRYAEGPGSEGTFRLYGFDQKNAQFVTSTGAVTTLDASKSFELTGNATQLLPFGLRSRTRLEFFSDLTAQQLYHANIYDASQRLRTLGGSVNGTWGPYSLSTTYQWNEAFDSPTTSTVYGSAPRVAGTLAQKSLFGLPIYAGATSEFAYVVYQDRHTAVPLDESMTREDLFPTIRVPFSKLTFLTVNTSASYRVTHYSESNDPTTGTIIDKPLTRSYGTVQTDIVGPVFTRIFDTPDNSFAERFKHVIEPTFSFAHISNISNYQEVPILTDGTDNVVGSTTFTYGVTNRLLARTWPTDTSPGQAREVLTATIQQTYYTTAAASGSDTAYASASQSTLSNLSPVALTVRAAPTTAFDTTVRIEESVRGLGMQVFSLTSRIALGPETLSTSWSRSRTDPTTPANNYVTATNSLRMDQGRITGNYSVSWDVGRGYIVSQLARVLYNAQCCGFGFEFQRFAYPATSAFPLPADTRINFSFMLAGLGTFQNFFGAFGGLR